MWELLVRPEAEADLASLDRQVAQRVLRKLRWLVANFENVEPEPLSGKLAGLLKLRVGDYRVVYEVLEDRGLITVHFVGHRRGVYKRR